MRAIAHSPKFAKKAGVPQSVGKDFAAADKGKKLNKGGEMAKKSDLKKMFKGKETKGEELKEAKAIKSGKITPEEYASGEKSEGVHKMKDGGSCYKEGGSVKKAPAKQQAKPTKAMQTAKQAAPKAPDVDRSARQAAMMQKVQANKAKQQAMPARPAQPAAPSPQQNMMQKFQANKAKQQAMPARPAKAIGGSAGMAAAPMNKMKAGGVTGSSIDGVAKRGKTKCMKNGGFVRAADGCATKGKTKGRFI
jgi:hypothetical protein